MIKAIFFDMGDIFFEAHYWRKWMWEKIRDLNKYSKNFREFYELYEQYLTPVYEDRKKYWDVFRDFLKEFNLENQDEFIRLAKNKKLFFENNRNLYSGVKETLKKLQSIGIKNIVITDNEKEEEWIRENILKKFDINQFVELVVTSKTTGVIKPHSKIFNYSLNYFNLEKDEVLFVGHDKDEIEGAKLYGIKTVLFNNYLNYETISDYKINYFRDLLYIIHNYC